MAFKELPLIDLNLARDPATKPQFLESLKHALFTVGFLYLVNHGIEREAQALLDLCPSAFMNPTDEQKQEIAMRKNPHFVGYTAFGGEYTNKAVDLREQYDFGDATKVLDNVQEDTENQWERLTGPSEFLSDDIVPGFEKTVTDYMSRINQVASEFLSLVAECLNLPTDTLHNYTGTMNRLKLVKYPAPDASAASNAKSLYDGSSFQGVGPHKDSINLFTFVLQDSVGGLEVLNNEGQWIKATPIKDSLVVNIAQGFEALTGGRCSATTHQVVSPANRVTRYSVPYFHSVRLDLTRDMINKQCSFIQGRIPEPTDMAKRSVYVQSEFIQPQYKNIGEAHLRNRIVSHKDVAAIWYPDLHQKYNLQEA